jgi:hypothetical protein
MKELASKKNACRKVARVDGILLKTDTRLKNGAARGNRTHDLSLTKGVLYH